MATKTVAKKSTSKKVTKDAEVSAKYIFTVGRRKSATASVRLFQGSEVSSINGKEVKIENFSNESIFTLEQPMVITNTKDKLYFTAKAQSGGINAQIGAVRLALARAIAKYDDSSRKVLKDGGFLTRDSREVERKKTGLRKARKATQYSKR